MNTKTMGNLGSDPLQSIATTCDRCERWRIWDSRKFRRWRNLRTKIWFSFTDRCCRTRCMKEVIGVANCSD